MTRNCNSFGIKKLVIETLIAMKCCNCMFGTKTHASCKWKQSTKRKQGLECTFQAYMYSDKKLLLITQKSPNWHLMHTCMRMITITLFLCLN